MTTNARSGRRWLWQTYSFLIMVKLYEQPEKNNASMKQRGTCPKVIVVKRSRIMVYYEKVVKLAETGSTQQIACSQPCTCCAAVSE